MKLGIVICTHNRPEYLTQCLDSLKRADIPAGTEIIIVDDNSYDQTIKIINSFKKRAFFRSKDKGICNSLIIGCDHLFQSCDMVMNLDSDALVRNDFIDRILELKARFPDSIVTGFDTKTKNADGSIRHKVISVHEGYNLKPSVGGINMCFNKLQYDNYVRPALVKCINGGNWDNQACIAAYNAGHPQVVVEPSVIQHIGIKSAMGHEMPDVADEFKLLSLPNVTLVAIDSVCLDKTLKAADACEKDILFGSVKILSHIKSKDKRVVYIPPIKSIVEYSEFIFKELHKYIDTDYALIFQHDGFVVNAKAWRKEWFQYDYIGAVWEWYKENKVGNGGFSLRSKKLLLATANIPLANDHLIKNYAEDHNISRIHRRRLVNKYGIKFAPEHEARQFSIEAWNTPNNKYSGQFGFHSTHVNFNEADIPFKPYPYPNHKRIINYP